MLLKMNGRLLLLVGSVFLLIQAVKTQRTYLPERYKKLDELGSLNEPLLFLERPVFEGHWVNIGESIKQFGDFENLEGWVRCQFTYIGQNKWRFFVMEIVDGVNALNSKEYMDNLKYSATFNMTTVDFGNLTNGTITFDNMETRAGKEIEIVRINYLTPTSEKISISAALVVKLIDKNTGEAFDINAQHVDLRVNYCLSEFENFCPLLEPWRFSSHRSENRQF